MEEGRGGVCVCVKTAAGRLGRRDLTRKQQGPIPVEPSRGHSRRKRMNEYQSAPRRP